MNSAVLHSEPELDCDENAIAVQTLDKPRILTVDDDGMILAMLAITLRKAGYDIVQASSAEEALDVIGKNRPDLAVLDISMPGMSGIELAQRLQEETDIPFMFLSSHTDDETVQQAIGSGAVAYLVKPIDFAKLVPTIESELARAKHARRLRKQETALCPAPAA